VVGYTFGQVQRTSKVERKTKCSKKTTTGDIAVLICLQFVIFFSKDIFLGHVGLNSKMITKKHYLKLTCVDILASITINISKQYQNIQ